jgi:hypothetical protein
MYRILIRFESTSFELAKHLARCASGRRLFSISSTPYTELEITNKSTPKANEKAENDPNIGDVQMPEWYKSLTSQDKDSSATIKASQTKQSSKSYSLLANPGKEERVHYLKNLTIEEKRKHIIAYWEFMKGEGKKVPSSIQDTHWALLDRCSSFNQLSKTLA